MQILHWKNTIIKLLLHVSLQSPMILNDAEQYLFMLAERETTKHSCIQIMGAINITLSRLESQTGYFII